MHVESFHSDAGSHHKLFRSWPRYWRDALGELESAAAELRRASHARVRLPW